MSYKLKQLLNVFGAMNSVKLDGLNATTSYLLARNGRKLEPIAKKFEEDRKKVLEASWVSEYNEMVKTDKEAADEKYKVEIAELEKEINDLLEEDIKFTFYTRKIDDVNFEGKDIFALYELIGEGE